MTVRKTGPHKRNPEPRPPSSFTVADLQALADRCQELGITSRRLERRELQMHLLRAAHAIRALLIKTEPGQTFSIHRHEEGQ